MAALGASGEQAPGVDFRTVEWAMSAIMARGLNAIPAARGTRHEAHDQLPDGDSYARLTRL